MVDQVLDTSPRQLTGSFRLVCKDVIFEIRFHRVEPPAVLARPGSLRIFCFLRSNRSLRGQDLIVWKR